MLLKFPSKIYKQKNLPDVTVISEDDSFKFATSSIAARSEIKDGNMNKPYEVINQRPNAKRPKLNFGQTAKTNFIIEFVKTTVQSTAKYQS